MVLCVLGVSAVRGVIFIFFQIKENFFFFTSAIHRPSSSQPVQLRHCGRVVKAIDSKSIPVRVAGSSPVNVDFFFCSFRPTSFFYPVYASTYLPVRKIIAPVASLAYTLPASTQILPSYPHTEYNLHYTRSPRRFRPNPRSQAPTTSSSRSETGFRKNCARSCRIVCLPILSRLHRSNSR